jgi:hypothetical protein
LVCIRNLEKNSILQDKMEQEALGGTMCTTLEAGM